MLERAQPASGASGVAAGIVNPFMGQRARPAFEHREALDTLATLLRVTALDSPAPGLARPARDQAQANVFKQRSVEHAAALAWVHPDEAADRWPDVAAPYGALFVRDGRSMDVQLLVERLLCRTNAELRSGVRGTAVEVDAQGAVETASGERLSPDVTILCTGAAPGPFFSRLPLHQVKGQLIRLDAGALAERLPILAGDGYVAPGFNSVLVGSTFEHHFTDEAPDAAGIEALRRKAESLVPALSGAPLLSAEAGVRVTVPGTRRPLIGPISRSGRLWVFNGLGAKGLMTAPLLASRLWEYLNEPARIPLALRPPIIV